MKKNEIKAYNKRCINFIGSNIDYNVATFDDDKSLTEQWNNDKGSWVHTPKGEGLPWYKVKHRNEYYQLFTDFTYAKLKKSELEQGCYYKEEYYLVSDLKFHSDWNWIYDIKNAIEKLGYYVNINLNECSIYDFDYKYMAQGLILTSKENTDKEAVIKTINKFLIWYENSK